ncbi:MAG: bifunctional precorrin-2 dehydrogenase/sirohydrochlorin ferrochelatase [Acidobacteriota bacterium]
MDHSASYEGTYFPLFVDLRGKQCVVVGAGEIAARKVEGLTHCGAEITVVSPRAVLDIRETARAGRLQWLQRSFTDSDVNGAFLVIAATATRRVNAAVFRACAERGILCNSVDDPEHCNFIYPAVVRRGALQIAVSTSGRSPALAARIRQDLEERFGPEWEALLETLGAQRKKILRTKKPDANRARVLQAAAADAMRLLLPHTRDVAPADHDSRKSSPSAIPTR